MSTLLDSLAADFDGDAAARASLDAVLRDGLPDPRSESWKYTSLRALERRRFGTAATASAIDGKLLASIPAPRLVFVNGIHDATLSNLAGLPDGVALRVRGPVADPCGVPQRADAVFARLNEALSATGSSLQVGAGIDVAPAMHLVFVGAPAGSDLASHLRHDILMEAGAHAVVVEHHLASGSHAHLANAVVRVDVEAGARLTHVRVQGESPAATCLLRTDVRVAAGATYERLDLELGAALSRHELNVRLEGSLATLRSNGVQFAQGRRHLDTRLAIEHAATQTACDMTWHGLAAGRGRVVFRGGITIKAGADGSDARLYTRNLLLSDSAEIDTQPVLEIHADEVKAAHGASVGQLDPTAIFYLRSRGLPAIDAERLLTAAFCRQPLGLVADEALRAALVEAVDAALLELPAS